jgi:uncharacterized membrane protein YkoI
VWCCCTHPTRWPATITSRRALSQRGDILPLEKIAERARAEKRGKLIDIELEQKKGIWVYEAEILDDAGRVWELKLDARTGELLKMEQDD